MAQGSNKRVITPAGVATDVLKAAAHNAVVGSTVIDGVGTTAQRPTSGLFSKFLYYDTTLSKLVVWVGGGGGIDNGQPQAGFWTDGTGSAV